MNPQKSGKIFEKNLLYRAYFVKGGGNRSKMSYVRRNGGTVGGIPHDRALLLSPKCEREDLNHGKEEWLL
jgi:hypothetical protein